MTAAALTPEQLADLPRALKGNICRCTGYGSIRDAIDQKPRTMISNGPCPPPPPGTSPPSGPASGPGPIGRPEPAPAGPDVVTGRARFTADLAPDAAADDDADLPPEPPLHMKLLRSPHAHAWIRSIDASAALRLDGVVTVLTYADSPTAAFSTRPAPRPGRRPLRHAGARPDGAVPRAAGRRRRRGDRRRGRGRPATSSRSTTTSGRPSPTRPRRSRRRAAAAPGPGGHARRRRARVRGAGNVCAELHREAGDAAAGFAAADAVYAGTFRTQRVQHVALETHATIGWLDPGAGAGPLR